TNAQATLTDALTTTSDFYFSLAPTAPDSYQVAFQMHDSEICGNTSTLSYGWDGGVHVSVSSPRPGFFGTVTSKATGAKIVGADVYVSGTHTTTDVNGFYWFPAPPAGATTVDISMGNSYAPLHAVHVHVPTGSGLEVDAALEERFTALD